MYAGGSFNTNMKKYNEDESYYYQRIIIISTWMCNSVNQEKSALVSITLEALLNKDDRDTDKKNRVE